VRPASQSRKAALDALVDDIVAADIGDTFNQYRLGGGADADPRAAPRIRAANLHAYLHSRSHAPVVGVAEAAGWRGARYSGISLFSERMIDEAGSPYRRTSNHPHGFAEPSASIVQGVLREGGWADNVLLWNVVPTHPAGPTPHSNRPPRSAEIAAGGELLVRLLDVLRPRHVAAIGRTAAAALPSGLSAAEVRHPAQSGASLCRRQLRALLAEWLGALRPAG
jgi:uracil DNA glycosylase superfamily protein